MYIHQSICISAQQTFSPVDADQLNAPVDNKLHAKEPAYEDIPLNILRRMAKAVRLGVGAAMPLVKSIPAVDGIIIGTANGGMEDCIKFLNQIVLFEEGRLTPTNFVQGTPNAVATQIGLITQNKGYNMTHVHSGLAFENALIDALMLLAENPGYTYLVGGVDEISNYDYRLEFLEGWYKKEEIDHKEFYKNETEGSIAGEGAAMFVVNNAEKNAIAKVNAVQTLETNDGDEVTARLKIFIEKNIPVGEHIDLFLSGENGDKRLLNYFQQCEIVMGATAGIARYKHFCGEFPTASAISLWLACYILKTQTLPPHFIKRAPATNAFKRILIYNHFKGRQHSLMLVSKC